MSPLNFFLNSPEGITMQDHTGGVDEQTNATFVYGQGVVEWRKRVGKLRDAPAYKNVKMAALF